MADPSNTAILGDGVGGVVAEHRLRRRLPTTHRVAPVEPRTLRTAVAGIFATGIFYAPDGPDLQLRPPVRRWHATKVALERYWLTRWWW